MVICEAKKKEKMRPETLQAATKRTLNIGKALLPILLVGLMPFMLGSAMAQDQVEEEFVVKTKTISGELTMLNSRFLGILSQTDKRRGYEKEILFLLDEKVRFVRKKREEIGPGDQVRVKYEEYYKLPEDRQEELVFHKRVAKEIQFLRRSIPNTLVGMETIR